MKPVLKVENLKRFFQLLIMKYKNCDVILVFMTQKLNVTVTEKLVIR